MADNLERLAAEYGFGEHINLLRKYLLPSIGFSLSRQAVDRIGSSRLGGGPDVPPTFDWPINNGRPLDFLLQINLAELASFESSVRLPPSGLLSFFYDVEEQPWGFSPADLQGHSVQYFPDTSRLQRAQPPDPQNTLRECAVQFWPAQTLPGFGSRVGDQLRNKLEEVFGGEVDWDDYDEIVREVFRANAPGNEGPFHQIGGHSKNVQGDMQLEAQLVMNGLYCGDESGYLDERATDLEKTCEEWTLLLQLDTDDDADFMWGDCGMLYFWTRSEDIARGDFSRTWCALQCF